MQGGSKRPGGEKNRGGGGGGGSPNCNSATELKKLTAVAADSGPCVEVLRMPSSFWIAAEYPNTLYQSFWRSLYSYI